MRKKIYIKSVLLLLFTLVLFSRCQTETLSAARSDYSVQMGKLDSLSYRPSVLSNKLDSFFRAKYLLGGFNASVLIARGNQVLYKGNFGYENFDKKDTLSSRSSFQLASVSKTFTATAILYLADQGLLSLDDTLGYYFPNFPYRNVKIKDLLSHRSGLPNYLHFGETYWKDKALYMTNDDLIALMTKYPWIEGTTRPNTHFQYCNTNYALLASIVEKVSGKTFPAFMRETIFEPLGMYDSYVYDVKASEQLKSVISYNSKWIPQKNDPYDGVYGDKGIYASATDMLKWNQALAENKVVGEKLQKEAYSPHSFERAGVRNYGYGWRLMKQPSNDYLVYHNGWWHGNNTVFYRYLPDNFVLIILSNRFNRSVYNVQPIFDIISGQAGSAGDFGEE